MEDRWLSVAEIAAYLGLYGTASIDGSRERTCRLIGSDGVGSSAVMKLMSGLGPVVRMTGIFAMI